MEYSSSPTWFLSSMLSFLPLSALTDTGYQYVFLLCYDAASLAVFFHSSLFELISLRIPWA
jgi:hypothetical protein